MAGTQCPISRAARCSRVPLNVAHQAAKSPIKSRDRTYIVRMKTVRCATLDSQFTPTVTYCVRRKTARWAKIRDEARWIAIPKDDRGTAHYVGLAIARTKDGADEQAGMWAKLLGVDSEGVTSTAVTLPWLWPGRVRVS